MMTNRKDFLKGVCAAAAAYGLPARVWGAAKLLSKPDLVIGLLSDIHIFVGPKDDPVAVTKRFRHALEYFRDRHVDGVLVTGDLTHLGLETELKAVADAWFSVFPGGKLPDGSPVANLMLYGDHDAEARFYSEDLKARFKNAGVALPRSLSAGELRKECWEKFFHEPWSPLRHVRVKGYDFVLSNFMREGGKSAPVDLDAQLKALKLDPAKPFFYGQHRYIHGTYLADEEMWGGDNGVSCKVLPAYPNCLAFQGHTHYMLTDERTVWIGDFVTMNNGALEGTSPGRMRENGTDLSWVADDYMHETQMPVVPYRQGRAGSVMILKGDTVVIERRDFDLDLPIGPDIVFSMDKKLRPKYADAARKAASVAPEFGVGAKGSVTRGIGADRKKRKTEQVTVSFPTVNSRGGRPRAYEYFVRAEKPDGTLLKEKRVYSPGINLPESKDAPVTTCVFAKRELADADAVRFVVRPANCWGVCGRPLRVKG